MIEIKDIHKSYGKQFALNGVSLIVQPGGISGLLGPNGCGKTTLIKSILGLVTINSGDILIAGHSILQGYHYRNSIGYMPQNPEFPTNLTIEELFKMLEDIRGKKASSKNEMLGLFDLHQHKGKKFAALSGGTKQKVAAVVAFMFNPTILILDEPTVGLDPISANRLKSLIKDRANGGSTILFVSHIMSEMDQLVDQITFLLDGKSMFSGSKSELLARSNSSTLENAVVNLIGALSEQ